MSARYQACSVCGVTVWCEGIPRCTKCHRRVSELRARIESKKAHVAGASPPRKRGKRKFARSQSRGLRGWNTTGGRPTAGAVPLDFAAVPDDGLLPWEGVDQFALRSIASEK